MGDKAGGGRASALSPLFGHDICNLCHLFLATEGFLSKVYLS